MHTSMFHTIIRSLINVDLMSITLKILPKLVKLEEITRPMIVELIEKIEVYEGNRVEITFRFHDEIADLLEELHQKQMGQREVSA